MTRTHYCRHCPKAYASYKGMRNHVMAAHPKVREPAFTPELHEHFDRIFSDGSGPLPHALPDK